MKNILLILMVVIFASTANAQISHWKNKVEFEENLISASSNVKDFKCLSVALYIECRACSGKEIHTLAQTFINRKTNENFPDSICKILDQKDRFKNKLVKQFPWVYNKRILTKFSIKEENNWETVQKYAYMVLESTDSIDISNGGIYFTLPHEVQNWTKKLEMVAKLPYHNVYKNRE
jgi:spore germination cell wall hydrolase CwlJ-like protein